MNFNANFNVLLSSASVGENKKVFDKFPRFKCKLIIVENFYYVCFIERIRPVQNCTFGLAKCKVLVPFHKPLQTVQSCTVINPPTWKCTLQSSSIIVCQVTDLFICHSVIQVGTFIYVLH